MPTVAPASKPLPAARLEIVPPPLAAGRCPNCESEAGGNFCSTCGQKQGELRPTFRELVKDFSKFFFRIDSKFLLTLRHLLTRPGFLTREYFAGRRERYERPLRLLVVLTIVSFLAIRIGPARGLEEAAEAGAGEQVGTQTGNRVSVTVRGIPLTVAQGPDRPEGEAAREVDPAIRERLTRFFSGGTAAAGEKLRQHWLEIGPKLSLALVPVFAWLLWLLYRRHDVRYAEHMVFAIHCQAFSQLSQIAQHYLGGWVVLVDLLYTGLAMRAAYGQGWAKTILKLLCYVLATQTVFATAIGLGFFYLFWTS